MFERDSRYVGAEGLRVRYRVRGPRSAPPLVLLHGIMGNAWEWDAAVERLLPRFRVYAPELRGHGRTEWRQPYTVPRLGDDVAALVRALDLWDVTVLGHSLGGLAGIFAVAGHPGRFGRLAVVDVGPRSLVGPAAAGVAAALRRFARRSYADPEEALAEWLGGDPYARSELLRHYVTHGLARGRDGLYRWRYDAAGLLRFVEDPVEPAAVEETLRRIEVPTLVLRGRHSPVLPAAEAVAMTRLLRRGELREVPGASHDMGVQQPEAVAAAVLEFADGAPRRGLVGGRRPPTADASGGAASRRPAHLADCRVAVL